MWQAISHLLREQLGEGEIELRNELPGGEIHAAWHLRYAGRDLFVKCDERELLPILTAEADQLDLVARTQNLGDGIKRCADSLLGVLLAHAALFCDLCDQFGFIHDSSSFPIVVSVLTAPSV